MGKKKGDKGKYWLPSDRRREIKNVCLCYRRWKQELAWNQRLTEEERETLRYAVDIVSLTARECGSGIETYLLNAITCGVPFSSCDGIPCGIDYFYERKRKCYFFLDQKFTDEQKKFLVTFGR